MARVNMFKVLSMSLGLNTFKSLTHPQLHWTCLWIILNKQKYHINQKYSDKQTWANSADPDQKLQIAVWLESTLFAIHPAIFRHMDK